MYEEGSLEARTRRLIAEFEREDKDHAFNDAGDGTWYAEKFAALLREWLAAEEWSDITGRP